MSDNFYCVIMAGGVGSRFWPVSRNSRPKQFLDILGVGRTFLQMTFDRFAKIIPAERILVVTSVVYEDIVREQLPQIPRENILLEPYKRNTAPCIAYATTRIAAIDENATVVVAPSDHFITNEPLFIETISDALEYASSHDELLTLGINPTRPETGYGYIQYNSRRSINVQGNLAYPVKTFTEKPDEELAKVFIDSGEFLWNSGIFVWSVKTISKALSVSLPEVYTLFKGCNEFYGTDKEESFISGVYENCPSISIDYGVMEKSRNVVVFKASFGWTDLGTWESLYLFASKDNDGNLIKSAQRMIDTTKDSLIISTRDSQLMVVKGLKNYMVVNTDDVLLIVPRSGAKFKEVMADLAVNDKSSYM